ncbi:MAG: hydroxyacylglutathione hydrolase [Bradymonadaceae bacterium]
MDVEIIESRVSDNYFYGLHADGEAALIDPVDGSGAVDWVREQGAELRYLINTHFHQDHTGGNPTVLGSFPGVELVAGETDADKVEAQLDDRTVDREVGAGDVLTLGGERLEVLDTPGHTQGHVSLVHGEHLFSGDTIFVGGAGNCSFGGDSGVLFRTFRDVLADLDDAVTFYPGHDYAMRDIEFILSIEPDNTAAEAMLQEARDFAGDLFVTTLGQEREYNPFFRYDDEELRDRLATNHDSVYETCRERSDSDEEAVFRTVRALRNEW